MTKFYANENFSLDLVQDLRQLGYDVLTSYEAGQANQSSSDEEVLKSRVGITHNISRLGKIIHI